MSTRKPLIGIPADRRLLGHHYFHCVGEKYIAAVAEGAQAMPVLIPSLGEGLEARELLADFDGILLTGSPSNVEPHRYSGPASDPGTLHDAWRDATTLPMIPEVVSRGLPLLAICRGFQEMNVASDRSFSGGGRAVTRARIAVASRVEVQGQPVFARAVRGLR